MSVRGEPLSLDRTLLSHLADGGIHSGARLAAMLGVSRAALWKSVGRLRALGVEVASLPSRGYRLARPLDLLSVEKITGELARQVQEPGITVEVVLQTGSTNADMLDRARRRAEPGVLFAETQSEGRGRWGRHWHSAFGVGLYLSLLWRFPAMNHGLGALSLACGVEVAKALRSLGADQIGLKWPNDIVAPEGKLGGILIELIGEPSGPCAAVVGLGLNYALSPGVRGGVDQPIADLSSALGECCPERSVVAGRVAGALIRACRTFEINGFGAFLPDWNALDVYRGRWATLSFHDHTVSGRLLGVDERGALCLEGADGISHHFSGDLQLRLRRDPTA